MLTAIQLDYAAYSALPTEAERARLFAQCDWAARETGDGGMTALGRLFWHRNVVDADTDTDADARSVADHDTRSVADHDTRSVADVLDGASEPHNRRARALSEADSFGWRPIDYALYYNDTRAADVLRISGAIFSSRANAVVAAKYRAAVLKGGAAHPP